MNLVNLQIENKIAFITINRPEKRNALNYDTVMELKKAFTKAETEPNARVIVLRGEGEHFCSGADLDYLIKLQKFSHEENLNDSMHLMQLYKLIYNLKKPVITVVQGAAMAGGCGLVAVSDFVIVSEKAKFGFAEVKIGFVPAIVSVFLVKKIGEGRARELLISGEVFGAERALNLGLVSEVTTLEKLEARVLEFASDLIERNSSHAMNATKLLLSKLSSLSADDALKLAAETNAKVRSSEDCKKGIKAFLEKEKISWNN